MDFTKLASRFHDQVPKNHVDYEKLKLESRSLQVRETLHKIKEQGLQLKYPTNNDTETLLRFSCQ